MINLKIGNKYRIRESAGVGKDKEALRAGIYRLIDVTEKGVFLFKPCEPGKCVSYRQHEVMELLAKGAIRKA